MRVVGEESDARIRGVACNPANTVDCGGAVDKAVALLASNKASKSLNMMLIHVL